MKKKKKNTCQEQKRGSEGGRLQQVCKIRDRDVHPWRKGKK